VEAAELTFPQTLTDVEDRPEVLAALEAAAREVEDLDDDEPETPPSPTEAPAPQLALAQQPPTPEVPQERHLAANLPAAVAAGQGQRNLAQTAKNDPLVAAAFESQPSVPTAPRGEEGKFTLQVISYDRPDPARAFARGLRARGHRAFVVEAEIPERGRYWRVRIGPFESKQKAQRYRAGFERDEQMNTYVVRRPKES
jgi:cell division septation protein DedD